MSEFGAEKAARQAGKAGKSGRDRHRRKRTGCDKILRSGQILKNPRIGLSEKYSYGGITMPRGGARKGAGRKPKSLSEKIAAGNPGKRPLTKVVFTDDSYDSSKPPDYIDKMIYRRSEHVTTPKEIYENTVRFLEPSGCLYLIPDMMIMDFAIAKYYLLLAQQEMTYSTIVGKNAKTDDIEITEYTEAMIKLQKNVLATWAPIWETVSRNSERVIDNPENDAMQIMFVGRKRKGAAKGGRGNGANAN